MTQEEQYSLSLLNKIHAGLIAASEDWRTLPSDPHNINTPVYIALLEVASVIEKTVTSTIKELK